MAINLGDINFGLGPDTRRLEAARRLIVQFGQDVNRAAKLQADGARAAEAALRRQERALVSASQQAANLNSAIRRSAGSEKLIDDVNRAFERLSREMTAGTQTALQYQRSQEGFQVTVARVARALKEEQQAIQQAATAQKEAAAIAVKSAKEIESAQRTAVKQAFDMARAQEQAAMQTSKAFFNAEKSVTAFNAAVARVKAPTSLSGQANNLMAQFQNAFNSAGTSKTGQMQSIQAFKKGMAELSVELDKFKAKAREAGRSGMEESLRRLADVSVLVSGPMSGLATRLQLISSLAGRVSIATAAMVTGLAAGAYAFVQLGKGAIEANKGFERIDMALTSLSGSSTIAAVQMANLMRTSDTAGTSFLSTAQMFTQLEAASAGTNLEGEATKKLFEQITFASTKMGLSQQDLEGALRAVSQIMSKGTVSAEELRGQLGDRIPGAVNIMAKALGVSTAKLGELMKKGQVSSDALIKFGDELARRLGVDTTKAIDNTVAAENRLETALYRFNKALDESVGYSLVYKAALKGLVDVIDWFATNIDGVFKTIGAAAGAAAAGMALMYAPALISGLTAVLGLIRGLAVAMVTFTTATLANPLGAIAGLLVRLAIVASGAAVGYELMTAAIGDTASAHAGAIPEVRQYIRAQEDMKYSIRDTTMEYIKQQEVMLQGLKNQINQVRLSKQQAEKTLFSEEGGYTMDPITGQPMLDPTLQAAAAATLKQTEGQLQTLNASVRQASEDNAKLNEILKKQTEIEKKRSDGLSDFTEGTKKSSSAVSNAMDQANDDIRKVQAALEMQGLPKYMQEWARVQAGINESIDQFRDKLVQAKVPLDVINAKTAEYGTLLRKLKEGEYYIKTTTSSWEALSGVLSRGMDNAMSTMVDDIMNGVSAMETLRNVGKAVVADLLKTFLQLSIVNPLKNALFGGDTSSGMPFQTLSGGLIGSLFGGLGGAVNGGGAGAHLAGGTPNWKGGMTWVGENGPERVSLPRGSRVTPTHRSSGRNAGNGTSEIVITFDNDGFKSYVKKAADAAATEKTAIGLQKGLDHYGETKFGDHFEKHIKHRRWRGATK